MNNYSLYDHKLLLHLLSAGDELAFTEIYDRFWQKLFAIAYNRLKEIQTAEDIHWQVKVFAILICCGMAFLMPSK